MDTQKPDQNVSEVSPDETEARLAAATVETEKLASEVAELHDRLLRAQADFVNARNRAERERSDYVQFACMDSVRNLLPVLDDFERALRTETPDREYARGVELIYQRFYDSLKRLGLEPIETKGKRFDPNQHEAVQREETTEAEDQMILAELQRGYNFKGKLLRPAWVKVAVRS